MRSNRLSFDMDKPGTLATYWCTAGIDWDNDDVLQEPSIKMMERFPLEDYRNWPLDDKMVHFAMPSGAWLEDAGCKDLVQTSYFTTTVTTGDYLHGSCLKFYEPVSNTPPSLRGLLKSRDSRHQWLWDMFYDYLLNNGIISGEVLAFVQELFSIGGDAQLCVDCHGKYSSAVSQLVEMKDMKDEILCDTLRRSSLELLKSPFDDFWKAMSDSSMIFQPKCIMLTSSSPIYCLLACMLKELLKMVRELKLDILDAIVHITKEVPEAPPGKYCVKFKLYELQPKCFTYSRPPLNRLPQLNCSLRPIFESLSPRNLINVFVCTLLERRMLFTSYDLQLVSQVLTGIQSLLFPLRWQSPYIPILPSCMVEVLHAPVPLLVGAHHDLLDQLDPSILEEFVMINLDEDRVNLPKEVPPPPYVDTLWGNLKKVVYTGDKSQPLMRYGSAENVLDTKLDTKNRSGEKKLWSFEGKKSPVEDDVFDEYTTDFTEENTKLEKVSVANVKSIQVFNNAVRKCFLEFFAYLIGDYNLYLGGFEVCLDELVNRKALLSAKDDEHADFWNEFIGTQMTQTFFEERIYTGERNFEIMLFDAWVKHLGVHDVGNEGQAATYSVDVSFLEDTSQSLKKDFLIPPPVTKLDTTNEVGFKLVHEWNKLPPLRELPLLNKVSQGDFTMLRDIDKVPHLVESVYLHFYTKLRLFQPRFKFAREKATSGLKTIEAICELAQSISDEFARYGALIDQVKKSDAFAYDTNGSAGSSLWGAFGSETSAVIQASLKLSRDVESRVCVPLREKIRALTTAYRILEGNNENCRSTIMRSKASMETAKLQKETALEELQKSDEEIIKIEEQLHTLDAASPVSATSSGFSPTSLSPSFNSPTAEDSESYAQDDDDGASLLTDDTQDERLLELLPMPPPLDLKASKRRRASHFVQAANSFITGSGKRRNSEPINNHSLQSARRKLRYSKVLCSRNLESKSLDYSKQVTSLVMELRTFTKDSTASLNKYFEFERDRIALVQSSIKTFYSLLTEYFDTMDKRVQWIDSILTKFERKGDHVSSLPNPALNEFGDVHPTGDFNYNFNLLKSTSKFYQSVHGVTEERVLLMEHTSKKVLETMNACGKLVLSMEVETLKVMFTELYGYLDGFASDHRHDAIFLRSSVLSTCKANSCSIDALLRSATTEHKLLSSKLASVESSYHKTQKAQKRLADALQASTLELEQIRTLKTSLELQVQAKTERVVVGEQTSDQQAFRGAVRSVLKRTTTEERFQKCCKNLEKVSTRNERLSSELRYTKFSLDRILTDKKDLTTTYNGFLTEFSRSRRQLYDDQSVTSATSLRTYASRIADSCIKNRWNITQTATAIQSIDMSKDLEKYLVVAKRTRKFAEDALGRFHKSYGSSHDGLLKSPSSPSRPNSPTIHEEADELPKLPPRPKQTTEKEHLSFSSNLADSLGVILNLMLCSKERLKLIQSFFDRFNDILAEGIAGHRVLEQSSEGCLSLVARDDVKLLQKIKEEGSKLYMDARLAKKQLKEDMLVHIRKKEDLESELKNCELAFHKALTLETKAKKEVSEYDTGHSKKEKRLFELRTISQELTNQREHAESLFRQQRSIHRDCSSQLLQQMERSFLTSETACKKQLCRVQVIGMMVHELGSTLPRVGVILKSLMTPPVFSPNPTTLRTGSKSPSLLRKIKRSPQQKAIRSWLHENVDSEMEVFKDTIDFLVHRRMTFNSILHSFERISNGNQESSPVPKALKNAFHLPTFEKSIMKRASRLGGAVAHADIGSTTLEVAFDRIIHRWDTIFHDVFVEADTSSDIVQVAVRDALKTYEDLVNSLKDENGLRTFWHRKSILNSPTETTPDFENIVEQCNTLQGCKEVGFNKALAEIKERFAPPRPTLELCNLSKEDLTVIDIEADVQSVIKHVLQM